MSGDGYSTPALDALRPKQRAFVVAYVCGEDTAGNASASVEAAGYKSKTPRNTGAQLLAKNNIANAVAELREQTTRKAERGAILSAAERLEICAEIARDKENRAGERLKAAELDAKLRSGVFDPPSDQGAVKPAVVRVIIGKRS